MEREVAPPVQQAARQPQVPERRPASPEDPAPARFVGNVLLRQLPRDDDAREDKYPRRQRAHDRGVGHADRARAQRLHGAERPQQRVVDGPRVALLVVRAHGGLGAVMLHGGRVLRPKAALGSADLTRGLPLALVFAVRLPAELTAWLGSGGAALMF